MMRIIVITIISSSSSRIIIIVISSSSRSSSSDGGLIFMEATESGLSLLVAAVRVSCLLLHRVQGLGFRV